VFITAVATALPTTNIVTIGHKVLARYAGITERTGAQGDPYSPSTTAAFVSKALDELEDLRLVERLPGISGAPGAFRLRALDGGGGDYEQPNPRHEHVVSLPRALFVHGWLGHLSPIAVACLLISIRERDRQFAKYDKAARRFDASREWIGQHYGIAPSSWSKGKEELGRFGILQWTTPPPSDAHPNRKRAVYELCLEALEVPAAQAPRWVAFSLEHSSVTTTTGAPRRLYHLEWRLEADLSPADRARLETQRRARRRAIARSA
jgi:hypothetical protein